MLYTVSGDQVPVIPFVEVVANEGIVAPIQYGPTWTKDGVIIEFTVKFKVAKLSQPNAVNKVAVCEPATLKVKPFQEYGNSDSQIVKSVVDAAAGETVTVTDAVVDWHPTNGISSWFPKWFPINTSTGPFAIAFTNVAPSALLIIITGIETFNPSDPPAISIAVVSLLIMITPFAPAFWAFNAFVPNEQVFL